MSMLHCTWEGCHLTASKPQMAKDGKQWANLCEAHDRQLSESFAKPVPVWLAAWVKAQGGPKAAADRF
jgi:hypothetical protein